MNRYAELSDVHAELAQAREDAQEALFSALGTRKEGDAQGEFARADAALSAWLDSDEGNEWSRLHEQSGGKTA